MTCNYLQFLPNTHDPAKKVPAGTAQAQDGPGSAAAAVQHRQQGQGVLWSSWLQKTYYLLTLLFHCLLDFYVLWLREGQAMHLMRG